jgi:uncharacterized membrane protein YdbT with pleckstrin-like domain
MEAQTTEGEAELWRGTPSQVENLPHYLLVAVVVIAVTVVFAFAPNSTPANAKVVGFVVQALLWLWGLVSIVRRFLRTRTTRYRITTQRIQLSTGIFSTRQEDVELRRVRDLTVERPAMLRSFGLGNIIVTGVDMSAPRLVLRAVPSPEPLRDRIRDALGRQLKAYGVQMVDYN